MQPLTPKEVAGRLITERMTKSKRYRSEHNRRIRADQWQPELSKPILGDE